jgi:hypothetical protein
MTIVNKGTKFVLVKNGFGDEGYQYHHVFLSVHGGIKIKSSISMVMKRALGVERTLLKRSLAVVSPAVLGLTLPG